MILEILSLRFIVRWPILLSVQDLYELTLQLADRTKLNALSFPSGYQPRSYTQHDKGEILALLNQCSFNFSSDRLDALLNMCIPGGVHLIEHTETRRLVSMMMSLHSSSKEFPFGGQIGWLATDRDHRGLGLGRLSAATATNHFLERGYNNIWVTTQPYRIPAIRIFNSLGFVPTKKSLNNYDWPGIVRTLNVG